MPSERGSRDRGAARTYLVCVGDDVDGDERVAEPPVLGLLARGPLHDGVEVLLVWLQQVAVHRGVAVGCRLCDYGELAARRAVRGRGDALRGEMGEVGEWVGRSVCGYKGDVPSRPTRS